MESIQQIATSGTQMANAAASVAGAMAKPRTAAAANNNTGSTSSSTADSSSTITADDFLTLLVAEMKNQDPTQPTDPNEYISQMVDVNSLQQLIGINQGITSLDGAAGVGGSTPASGTSGAGSQ
jgi:flagellar basal-body rod modification protein FlgD